MILICMSRSRVQLYSRGRCPSGIKWLRELYWTLAAVRTILRLIMKAVVFAGPGNPLQLRQLPDPEPGPGEVVLRVERCGICASELHLTGVANSMFPSGMILGHEVGGEVIALGRGVDQFKIGDAVVPMNCRGCTRCAECLSGRQYFCAQMAPNFGGYAQYMISSAAACVPVPVRLSLADAALVEPLTVGLHAVTIAPLQPNDRVLVIGAGPIGLGAIFWANRFGARRVVVTARSNRSEQIALSMGATGFVPMLEGYQERILQELGGPADLVIECVGSGGTISKAVELVKPRGTIVVVGLCLHAESFISAPALLKEVKIQFAIGTSKAQIEAAANVLAAGAVMPRAMVTETISLEALPGQFEAMRRHNNECKVLVAP
jgi:(R,R)-butanediol dehydrogenase/meso-butanediol dehydrogenase/diacetyl reductase